MKQQLVVIAGPEKGRSFSLENGQTLVIGRGQASDTQINDPHLSRVHCQVEVDRDKVILTDRRSSGGTYIDETRVTERELRPGMVFCIGDTRIRYLVEQPQEESTMVRDAPANATETSVLGAGTDWKSLVGQSFAHYRLDEIVHKGSSGMLFKAYNTENNRPAAVKVLSPDCTNSDDDRGRFVRAMKTMINIRHENIVELYNAGKQGPYCWAAMEFIKGDAIVDVIRLIGVQGMLDWREAYRVAVHIGRALQAAYEHKIIHRNVTPTNIMRREGDQKILLCDLMLAKALEGTLAKQITQPGQLVGEVAYMSPERTRSGSDVDCRSDIYGLGATVYALLTGRPPFESNSLPELIHMVREEQPIRPKEFQMSIHDRFQDAVMHMLEKRPEDRYQTPAELLRDLDRVGTFANVMADKDGWVD